MMLDNSHWAGHRYALLRYVERRVDNSALSEDIVQEAIVKMLVYGARPGNQVGNVPALLRRIALDLTRDHYRRSGRNQSAELTDDIPCPQADAQQMLEQRQLVDIVLGVLLEMPPLRREVFLHRRIERLPSKKVAAMLDISPGAVDAHVARAVLDLHIAVAKLEKRERLQG